MLLLALGLYVASFQSPWRSRIGPMRFVAGWHKRWPGSGRLLHHLNQTLVLLGLVLHMFVVVINCCLGFLCCHLVVVIFVLLLPAKWLVRKQWWQSVIKLGVSWSCLPSFFICSSRFFPSLPGAAPLFNVVSYPVAPSEARPSKTFWCWCTLPLKAFHSPLCTITYILGCV